MKVINNKEVDYFGNLCEGVVFSPCGNSRIFMKTSYMYDEDSSRYDAVDLADGELTSFYSNCEVIIHKNAALVLDYKGEED